MPRLALLSTRAVQAVAAALVAAIVALVFAQVAVRYVLGGSLVWSEELTRVLFVWMVLLAAATAAPMRIEAGVQAVPARLRGWLAVLSETVVIGLTLVLTWGAFGMADLTAFDRFTALDLSVSWIYWALVVSGGLWLLRSAVGLTVLMRQALRDGPGP